MHSAVHLASPILTALLLLSLFSLTALTPGCASTGPHADAPLTPTASTAALEKSRDANRLIRQSQRDRRQRMGK